jgi:hypothetical protein
VSDQDAIWLMAAPSLAASVGRNYEMHFHPAGSNMPSRLDRYRTPLESLTEVFDRLLG